MSRNDDTTPGRLVVLGGSSPFTVGLIDALTVLPRSSRRELVLQGRTRADLDLVRRYAASRLEPLGWSVSADESPEKALAGAWSVVHQNRYGGIEGRIEDEEIALRAGVQPDETLGPAALSSVLRVVPEVRRTGRLLARVCPEAWVLNLTNPLSVTTSELRRAGVRRCIGLCELPRVTARRAAGVLGLPFREVRWQYVGLNHRGFLGTLEHGGVDRIAELIRRSEPSGFEGVPTEAMLAVQAVPTKYFRLVWDRTLPPERRAATVASIRRRALEELHESVNSTPPTLSRRYMEWYPESVVPLIAALSSEEPTEHVVNLPDDRGLTVEIHANVDARGIEALPPPTVSSEAGDWLRRFERHEQALLAVARDPARDAVRRALALYPMLAPRDVDPLLDRLCPPSS